MSLTGSDWARGLGLLRLWNRAAPPFARAFADRTELRRVLARHLKG